MSSTEGTYSLSADGDADPPTEGSATATNGPALYWSKRGEVACTLHMPPLDSDRWLAERWAELPSATHGRHGIRYQCQHCADLKTPIAHRRVAPNTSE